MSQLPSRVLGLLLLCAALAAPAPSAQVRPEAIETEAVRAALESGMRARMEQMRLQATESVDVPTAEIVLQQGAGKSMANAVVNTTIYERDGSCSDGDCSIVDALDAASGGGTVTFASSLNGATIVFNTTVGTPSISGAGTINIDASALSGGIAFSGNNEMPLLEVGAASVVTVTNIVFTNGSNPEGRGGALVVTSNGSLTVEDCTVSDSQASTGGGIASLGGYLEINNSIIEDNESSGSGGGVYYQFAPDDKDVVITNSTIRRNVAGPITDENGEVTSGGFGGGITYIGRNVGTLTIEGSSIQSNTASPVPFPLAFSNPSTGGGIFAGGEVTVTNTNVSSNNAQVAGGMYVGGDVDMQDVVVEANLATRIAGGILLNNGETSLERVDVKSNTSVEYAGGILNRGVMILKESSVKNNHVNSIFSLGVSRDAYGGGIVNNDILNVERSLIDGNDVVVSADVFAYGGGVAASGETTITNSTISNNSVTNTISTSKIEGSSIDVRGAGNLTLRSTTVSRKSSGQQGSAAVSFQGDELSMVSSVIEAVGSNNPACRVGSGARIVANAYMFISDGTCNTVEGGTPTGFLSGDPLLGNLADNGGPTQTLLPQSASPLIDAGTCDGLTTDQRGETRPRDVRDDLYPNVDDGCDIGAVEATAVEVQPQCDGVCYVDASATGTADGSSWANAYRSVQDALLASGSGDQVWVAGGAYYPDTGIGYSDGIRASSFHLKSGVTVYGGFEGGETNLDQRDIAANPTVLSGDLDQNDGPGFTNNVENACHVVTADGVDATALLDGVTVTAGHANCSGVNQSNGGGILVTNGSPTLTRLTVTGNTATGRGGGFYSFDGDATITATTFTGNTAAGGAGGLQATGSAGGSLTLDAVTVTGNRTTGTGGGGGVVLVDATGTISNSTITDNTAAGTTGGLIVARTSATLTNTILYGNTDQGGTTAAAQVLFSNAATLALNTSVVQGGVPSGATDGGGNLSADPLLGPLADNGGPTLTHAPEAGSPAIDIGGTCGPTDQRGFDAPQDGDGSGSAACDAGAVERQGFAPVQSQIVSGGAGWRMLATPSTGATVGGFLDPLWTQCFDGADYNGPACAGSAPNVYRYDEAVAGDLALGYVPPASAAEALAAGTGLFVYGYTDGPGALPQTLEPTGAEPEAPFAFSLSYTDNGDQPSDAGWNLVGNPFLVGLDWDEVTRPNVSGAVYVYDPVTDDYLTYSAGVGGNLGGVVPSVVAAYQGFWVQATAEAPAIEAPASARVSNGAFQGRTASTSAPAVELVVSGTVGDATLGDILRVARVEGATLGVDDADAYELSGFGAAALDVFAVAEGPDGPVALDISAVPPDVTEVDLDVRASGADASVEVVMTWPEVSVEGPVVLVDRQTGEEIDLRAASVYRFTVDATAEAAGTAKATSGVARLGEATDAADVRTTTRLSAPRPLRVGAEGGGRSGGARFALRFGSTPVGTGDDLPTETALGLPRPNPTSGGARVTLSLAEAGVVRAEVFDALGRRVAVVTDGELGVGRHELAIPSQALAPGTYVVRVVAGDQVLTRRLSVVR